MRKLHEHVLSRLSPPAPKNVAVSFSCFSLVDGTFCSQKLNLHQDQGAVFGMDASSAEAQMKGGKSISIVAQTLSGGWGSAQPFGMSPGRETPAAEQTKTPADDSNIEGAFKAKPKTSLSLLRPPH